MKLSFVSCALLMLAVTGVAQQSPRSDQSQNPPATSNGDFSTVLGPIEQAANATSLDLAHLRIEKWKGDKAFKADTASRAASLERNLTAALPEMVAGVRAAPTSMAPALKLYRNLNVVYDVLATVVESAGAFGPKDEFRALATDLDAIDGARRSLADTLERTAAAHDAELIRLRNQSRSTAAAPSDVKKIVVDDNQPAPKPRKRKPVKAPPPPAGNPQ